MKISISILLFHKGKTKMSNDLQKSSTGTVLGVISLVAWFIPLVGFPVSILGIRSSMINADGLGSALSVIGLILTVINSVMGAMMYSN